MIGPIIIGIIEPILMPILVNDASTRWALNFDGVGIRGLLASEVTLTGDWFVSVDVNPESTGVSADLLGKELFFKIQALATGAIAALVGNGSGWVVTLTSLELVAYNGLVKKIRITKVGTIYTLFINGVLQQQFNNAGTVTPVISHVGVRSNLSSTSFARGIISNVNINGTLWPIADRNQAIQLPEPSGLGADDIGTALFATAVGYDNLTVGTATSAIVTGVVSVSRATKAFSTPVSSYLVECTLNSTTSPVTLFIRDGSVAGTGTVITSQVLTLSLNRLLFNRISGNANILFTTSSAANYSVSGVSIKQIGTCNPMTISNATSANWVEVPV